MISYIKFKKYFFSFLFLSVFFVASIGVFALTADFSGLFSLTKNSSHIKISTGNRRLVIPGIIERYNPKCIITGTSRVGRGINPLHNLIKDKYCINLFMNAGDAREIYYVLKFAHEANKNLDSIYLGIDFFMFDENLDLKIYQDRFREFNYSKRNIIMKIFNNPDLILSKDAIKKSIKAVRRGVIDYRELQINSFHDKVVNKKMSELDTVYNYAKEVFAASRNEGHGYGEFVLSKDKLNNLILIIRRLADDGIDIKVWINPLHVFFQETIFQLGYYRQYKEILKRFSEIDAENVRFVNYSGYNDVSTRLSLGDYAYFPDAGHYSKAIGDKIINHLESHEPPEKSFGQVITSSNVENKLAELMNNRKVWIDNHPDEYRIVKETIHCSKNNRDKRCIGEIVLKNYDFTKAFIDCMNIDNSKNMNSPEGAACSFQRKHLNSMLLKNKDAFKEYIDNHVSYYSSPSNYYQKKIHTKFINLAGKEMVVVPAGKFLMGSFPGLGLSDEMLLQYIHVDSYWIDREEVTVSEYNKIMDNDRHVNENYGSLPVRNVTWQQADEYCNKIGKRLPTEAEWEKAARGISGARYPWGNMWPDCNFAIFDGEQGVGCGLEAVGMVRQKSDGVSPYGLFDMAGNVSEYVSDNYNMLHNKAFIGNKINNGEVSLKVVKGGNYRSGPEGIRSAARTPWPIDKASDFIGFRCAISNVTKKRKLM